MARDPSADRDQLLADAHALQRLAATPEWAVLARLLDEHAARITAELCQRGLEPIQTEGLRAELAAVGWLRARPAALQDAVDDLDAIARASDAARDAATASPQIVSGPEPFASWYASQGGPR
jgi:hypothetical protein